MSGPTTYVLAFPIWTVVDAAIHHEKGFPLSLRFAGSPGYGNMFPLFDRRIAATLWGAGTDTNNIEAFEIADAETLIRLMSYYQMLNIQNVAINPSPDYTVPAERYASFNEIRAAFAR